MGSRTALPSRYFLHDLVTGGTSHNGSRHSWVPQSLPFFFFSNLSHYPPSLPLRSNVKSSYAQQFRDHLFSTRVHSLTRVNEAFSVSAHCDSCDISRAQRSIGALHAVAQAVSYGAAQFIWVQAERSLVSHDARLVLKAILKRDSDMDKTFSL